MRWEDTAQRGSRHTTQGQQRLTRQKTAIKAKGEKHERKVTQALEKGEARQQQGLLGKNAGLACMCRYPCKGVLESSTAGEPEHSAPPPTYSEPVAFSFKISEMWVFV